MNKKNTLLYENVLRYIKIKTTFNDKRKTCYFRWKKTF